MRPLIAKAIEGDREALELELAQEQIRGKAADRAYWAPLRAELEALRAARRFADTRRFREAERGRMAGSASR